MEVFLAERVTDAMRGSSLPCVVGICGWADTGKSTLANKLACALRAMGFTAEWISTDAFMKERAERNALGITGYDPSAIDAPVLARSIQDFTSGVAFEHHPYDNKSGTRQVLPVTIPPGQVLVVEGIHALHPLIEHMLSFRIFIDADERTLRHMRERANIFKRGMGPAQASARIQHEWDDFCAFVLPRKALADLVIAVSADYDYSQ